MTFLHKLKILLKVTIYKRLKSVLFCISPCFKYLREDINWNIASWVDLKHATYPVYHKELNWLSSNGTVLKIDFNIVYNVMRN